jgi:tetratricopeptide (TPR) repeat protein
MYTFVNIYKADSSAKGAETALKELNLPLAQKLAERSIELNPNEPYYYRLLAKVYLTTSFSNKEYKDRALSLLDASLKLNKNNLATIRNNTPIYYYLALNNLSGANGTVDKKYIKFASSHMTHYKKIYPTDLGLIVLFAKYEKKLNLMENYNESIKQIKILRPDVLKWYAGI